MKTQYSFASCELITIMSAFHMDMAGPYEKFLKIPRSGNTCAIRNNGRGYLEVPCAWCSKMCKASSENCLTDKKLEFIGKQLKESLLIESDSVSQIPECISNIIAKYTFNTDPEKEKFWRFAHKHCVEFPTKTKSGRKVRPVRRLGDEEFVTGSGVCGCDQYDRGFDGHFKQGYDYETYGKNDHSKLSDFIVDDDDEEEVASESESEAEYSDSDDSDSDEDFTCQCCNLEQNDYFRSAQDALDGEWTRDYTGWTCDECSFAEQNGWVTSSDSEVSEDDEEVSKKD